MWKKLNLLASTDALQLSEFHRKQGLILSRLDVGMLLWKLLKGTGRRRGSMRCEKSKQSWP
jgi:hypothetical protein